ncbi:MAG: hypothetical protein ACYTKD_13825 [Planctomycetota bacterium]|jgi:hypothetical protein
MDCLRLLGWLAVALPPVALLGVSAAAGETPGDRVRVHSVTDISHEFSFYFDGRFARNYLSRKGNVDVRNWGTLHKFDRRDVNLMVLQSGASPCAYLPEDVAAVTSFLAEGGGVIVLGDYTRFRDQKTYRLNDLVSAFGAEFVDVKAKSPAAGTGALAEKAVKSYGGKTIRLTDPPPGEEGNAKAEAWEVLVRDAKGAVIAARRKVVEGKLLVTSRALSGRRPDAKDPINAEWLTPLLEDLASGKRADPKRRPKHARPENVVVREGLRIRYSDYMQPFADEIFEIYRECRPVIERTLGVPPAKNMLTGLILLPTGGGFSSGREIGLGTWWGGFPEKRYGMIELLSHEATHSWVLPFGEPMWNEGIATYVGILIGRQLGCAKEADATLAGWIKSARRHDADMTKLDLARGEKIPHVVRMAKPMWIWEELRKGTPDLLARYFRAKRRLADPKTRKRYTADDCVAVLSIAAGRDLFEHFRSLGIDVERERSTIPGVPGP